MAQSSSQSGRPPIQQLQTIADLLETPVLARLYAYILQHGPVTVSEPIDKLNIPQGTAYDYVQKLQTAGLVKKTVSSDRMNTMPSRLYSHSRRTRRHKRSRQH